MEADQDPLLDRGQESDCLVRNSVGMSVQTTPNKPDYHYMVELIQTKHIRCDPLYAR